MTNSPTDVGPHAFYQFTFELGNLKLYVRNDCTEKPHWHTIRASWTIKPGRFLGEIVFCTGDLGAVLYKKWSVPR